MLNLGPLAFTSPWIFAAAAVLPVIWWLLRVMPPTPRRIAFPAIRLLFGLRRREETPDRTPPWLILLRLAVALLLILAFSGPLLNPGTDRGAGPMIIVVDDGWAAARHWQRREQALAEILDRAARTDRPVALLSTAPETADGQVRTPEFLPPSRARSRAAALAPKPWRTDRAAAGAALKGLELEGDTADVLWLSDGLDGAAAEDFADTLARYGTVRIMLDPETDLARVLSPPESGHDRLRLRVARASSGADETLWLRASSERGALLLREPVRFEAGSQGAEVSVFLAPEVRNRITRLEIEGEASAAATVLLDERWRRRPVGLVSADAANQPFLSGVYYIERALAPFSEVRVGTLDELLHWPLATIVLDDVGKIIGDERAELDAWLESGGVLVRFAGPQVAEGVDDLVPVRLRRGDRILGGVLSWNKPAALGSFDEHGPFAGLGIPADVRIKRQVLAEPALDLGTKTWARLADGTPLVTGERRGQGWLVLVHTTADPAWSNLPISGLFVAMLQRLVGLSHGVAHEANEGILPPLLALDGFGRLRDPSSTSKAIGASDFATATPGPRNPPGFYGTRTARRALNLSATLPPAAALDATYLEVDHRAYGEAGETDLKPWFLAAAAALVLADMLVGLALRGLLPGLDWARRATVLGVAAPLVFANADPAWADDSFALAATLETRLSYALTGDPEIDNISQAALKGLSATLRDRTSIEPGDPMGIDVETDPLIFFPLIYWPVTPEQVDLSPAALAKVDHYLTTGGIILFDTRDQRTAIGGGGGVGPGERRLRELLRGLNLPPLVPVPPEHVLTRAFYLVHEFPGRWTGGTVWVEHHEGGVNDGVSSLIVGSHDWASAWAIDAEGKPMFAVIPGAESQREMAFRFGINLVMYAMTGNYKADQVHLPAILERLGQ